MANNRSLTAALIALLSASLATASWAGDVESAPRLTGAVTVAPALPSAVVPVAGDLSLAPSFISAPNAVAAQKVSDPQLEKALEVLKAAR